MNFYNNKIDYKKYLGVLKNYDKIFSKEFILQNYGLFVGDKSFYRILACYDLLRETKDVKGDVIEFGIWNGNNLFALKKIIDFLNIDKKIYGYDNFLGFPNPLPKYKKAKKGKLGFYTGDPSLINYIKKYYNLKKIKIINDDIMNLRKHSNKFSKLSFIYIDCDVYEPVTKIFEELNYKLSIGGIIAFDEANKSKNSGEARAMNEFYERKIYSHYKKIESDKPSFEFKKISLERRSNYSHQWIV